MTDASFHQFPNAKVARLPGVGRLSTFYRSDLTLPIMLPFFKDFLG